MGHQLEVGGTSNSSVDGLQSSSTPEPVAPEAHGVKTNQ